MAFWGIEVKSGTPYLLQPDKERRRLHVSKAVLCDDASFKERIRLQCTVGNKNPIHICSLWPDCLESCALNLEFEETEGVTFTIIGNRSVHLSGFFYRDKVKDCDGDEYIMVEDSCEQEQLKTAAQDMKEEVRQDKSEKVTGECAAAAYSEEARKREQAILKESGNLVLSHSTIADPVYYERRHMMKEGFDGHVRDEYESLVAHDVGNEWSDLWEGVKGGANWLMNNRDHDDKSH